jgi:hypothetical protein
MVRLLCSPLFLFLLACGYCACVVLRPAGRCMREDIAVVLVCAWQVMPKESVSRPTLSFRPPPSTDGGRVK